MLHAQAHAYASYKRVSSQVPYVQWRIEVVDGGFAGALEQSKGEYEE